MILSADGQFSTGPVRIGNFMDSPLEDLEKKGNLSEAVRLYNPNRAAQKVVHFTPSSGDLRFRKLFAAQNVDIQAYFRRPNPTSLYRRVHFPEAFAFVCKTLQAENLNVVRGRLPYVSSLLGCTAAKLLGIPSVVSLGGDNRISQERSGNYYFGNKHISYGFESFVLRICDAIIAPNAFTAAYVARIIGKQRARHKVAIIPWILAPSVHIPDNPRLLEGLRIDPSLPIVLIVGFLNQYKHSDIMFEVARRACNNADLPCQFVFCGDGPLRKQGEGLLAGFPNVRFLGFRQHDVVWNLIRRSAVVLVPMSGFVLLEAAALGRPVIASDIEWHGEVIHHGKTGYLARARSVDDWLEKLRRILQDETNATHMGQRLLGVYEVEFNPTLLLDKELALYHTLISQVQ